MAEIRIDEWLAELTSLTFARNDTGMSLDELVDASGMSKPALRDRLKRAHAMGRLKVGFRSGTMIDGRPKRVPVYSILPE